MPSGINAWLSFLTFDLLIKIVILHALLAVSMTNTLLVLYYIMRKLILKAMKNSQVMGAETVWGTLKMAKRLIFCTSILEKPG